jgi:hypothetical protein
MKISIHGLATRVIIAVSAAVLIIGLTDPFSRATTGTGLRQDRTGREVLTSGFGPGLVSGVEALAECVRVLRLEKRQYLAVIEGMADGVITVDGIGGLLVQCRRPPHMQCA